MCQIIAFLKGWALPLPSAGPTPDKTPEASRGDTALLLLGLQTYSRFSLRLLGALNSPVNPAWGRTSNLILPTVLKTWKPLFISIDESLIQFFVSYFRQFKLGAVLVGGSCGFSAVRDYIFLDTELIHKQWWFVVFSWQMDLVQCAALVGFNHPWKGQFCSCDCPPGPDHRVHVLVPSVTLMKQRAGVSPFHCALYRDFPTHRAIE